MYGAESKRFHEAAYDAYTTGVVYAKLLHHASLDSEEFQAKRNKLHLMFSMFPHMDLAKDEGIKFLWFQCSDEGRNSGHVQAFGGSARIPHFVDQATLGESSQRCWFGGPWSGEQVDRRDFGHTGIAH